jgi:hypothetical protein
MLVSAIARKEMLNMQFPKLVLMVFDASKSLLLVFAIRTAATAFTDAAIDVEFTVFSTADMAESAEKVAVAKRVMTT